MRSPIPRTVRRLGVLVLAAPAAVALVAAPVAAQTTGAPPQFATGLVTSVHGTSVQVQNQTQNSESTVVLGASTSYQKRETVAPSAITTGACVRVTGTGSAAKGITANDVALTTATNGDCSPNPGGNGVFGGNGGRRFGNGQAPGAGADGSRPPRSFGGGNGTRPVNFAAAFGPVVSISGNTMTVKATVIEPAKKPKAAKGSSSKKAATTTTRPRVTTTTKNVKVTLASSTTITQTVSASASDVTVGACVTAIGQSAAGAVDATNVTVSAPVNGTCTAGFGGRGFGRFGGGGPGGPGGGGGAGSGNVTT